MSKFTVLQIDDYMDRLTERQKKELIQHCNKYNIAPEICAWYDDLDDLLDDYKEHCGYSKETTMTLFESEEDMFCKFSNGEIVKSVK